MPACDSRILLLVICLELCVPFLHRASALLLSDPSYGEDAPEDHADPDGGHCHLMLDLEGGPDDAVWTHEGGVPNHWSQGLTMLVVEKQNVDSSPFLSVLGECQIDGGEKPRFVIFRNGAEVVSGLFRETEPVSMLRVYSGKPEHSRGGTRTSKKNMDACVSYVIYGLDCRHRERTTVLPA
jgi:hypothetical protein